MRRAIRNVWQLRPEEAIALVFFLPSLLVTARAYRFFARSGEPVPPRFQHGFLRLGITVVAVALFVWFVRRKPWWSRLGWIREVMPFAFCIAIYTNLNDTIHFVNPHDAHDVLIRIDQWMFGVQPCVWAQRFYTPFLTELFSIGYMNYFVISVAVTVYLLVARRRTEMREALFGTILCFYMGYFLYIAVPAAPPRLTLVAQFTRDFTGGWVTDAQNQMISLNPNSSRGAFPSLHCAVTLISVMYAWKFQKKLFAVLLPMGITLVLATIYLRHHYVIDILAGFALAILAYNVAPPFDRWWVSRRASLCEASPQANVAPATRVQPQSVIVDGP